MNEDARKVLELARVRLDAGWTQGVMGDTHSDDGPVCLLGALEYATNKLRRAFQIGSADNAYMYSRGYVMRAIRDVDPAAGAFDWSIARYNDTPNRTLDQVKAVIDKALEIN